MPPIPPRREVFPAALSASYEGAWPVDHSDSRSMPTKYCQFESSRTDPGPGYGESGDVVPVLMRDHHQLEMAIAILAELLYDVTCFSPPVRCPQDDASINQDSRRCRSGAER